MGFISHDNIFVNREKDLKDLGRDVLNAMQNTACILYAEKGRGKTALIQKVMDTYSGKHLCIVVNPGITSGDIQGGYIQAVFYALFKEDTLQNVDSYFMSLRGEELELYANYLLAGKKENAALKTASKILLWVLPLWVSLFGLDIFAKSSFFYQYRLPVLGVGLSILALCNLILWRSQNIRVQLSRIPAETRQLFLQDNLCTTIGGSALPLQLLYISNKLSSGGYIFHMMNIQTIDDQSQRALAQWIHIETKNIPNYFFLEFQTDDDSKAAILESFLEHSTAFDRKSDVRVETYHLSSLSERHIRELAGKLIVLSGETEDEICLYWKEKANGDLFEIIRFIRQFNSAAEATAASERFARLSREQKLILLLCLFAQSPIPQSKIIQMTESVCAYAIADIQTLEIDGFISISENKLWIREKEFVKNWETLYQAYDTVQVAAQSIYERFFWEQLRYAKNDTVDYYCLVDSLLRFYVAFLPKKLENILVYIAQNANLAYNRERLEECFSTLWKVYLQKPYSLSYHTFPIISCCYNLELYQLAKNFLALIPENSEKKIVYNALLLNRVDRYKEAVTFCRKFYNQDISNRLSLMLKQVELISLRMLYRTDECWTIFQELENAYKYHKFPEYGIFLRNAEIIVSVEASLKYLKRSIRFFRQLQDTKNAGISMLSLGMQQARIGHFQLAVYTLKQSRKLLSKYGILTSHYYQTDIAAVYLLEGRKSKQIANLLSKAEVTAQTDFDQLVILVDKLAYCILMKDKARFYHLIDRIKQDRLPNIVQVLRSVYFNVSVMYKLCGEEDEARSYLDRSRKCHEQVAASHSELPLNALWNARYTGDSSKLPRDLTVLYRKPYHVSFISFWHFDIPDF